MIGYWWALRGECFDICVFDFGCKLFFLLKITSRTCGIGTVMLLPKVAFLIHERLCCYAPPGISWRIVLIGPAKCHVGVPLVQGSVDWAIDYFLFHLTKRWVLFSAALGLGARFDSVGGWASHICFYFLLISYSCLAFTYFIFFYSFPLHLKKS